MVNKTPTNALSFALLTNGKTNKKGTNDGDKRGASKPHPEIHFETSALMLDLGSAPAMKPLAQALTTELRISLKIIVRPIINP